MGRGMSWKLGGEFTRWLDICWYVLLECGTTLLQRQKKNEPYNQAQKIGGN
jgi:hypothetical protein